jgi:hypothetical protein
MKIMGYVRDREPNKKWPVLELYFRSNNRSALPQGDREPIELDINGVRWQGTINSTNPTNKPYVHSSLHAGSKQSSCSEVLLNLGLAENAQIEFDLTGENTFRLVSIVNKGQWRPGNAPHER